MFWLYLLCHFGNDLTQNFEGIGTAAFYIEWYLMPLDAQKCMPMILGSAQNNVYLCGLAGTLVRGKTSKRSLNQLQNTKLAMERFYWSFFSSLSDHEYHMLLFYGAKEIRFLIPTL